MRFALPTPKTILIIVAVILVCLVLLSVRGIVMLKRQVAVYREYWLEQNSQSHPANTIRYFALGDSAAQGIGASSPDKGYVGLVAKEIAARTGEEPKIINLSVSGARVGDVLNSQLPALLSADVKSGDVVTVSIGANDMGDFDAGGFRRSFTAIAKSLPPQTVVADIPYFGGGIFRSRQANALAASQIIKEVAADETLRVAELQASTKENDSLRNYAADFFHPSDRAYKFWAEAFVSSLYQ